MTDQNVNIKITADAAQASSAIDDAKQQLAGLGERGGAVGEALGGLTGKLGAVALAAAGAAAVIAGGKWVAGLVSGAMDAADRLGELGQAAGVSGSVLSQYQLAASNAGTSIEGLASSMGRMNVKVGEALSGNKEAADAFARLGMSVTDLKSMSPDEIFRKIADRTVEAGGASKIASELNTVLGRSWQELAPLLAQGGDGLEEAAEQARALGLALSDGTINAADQTTDALAMVGAALTTGFANKVMVQVMPTLKGLADRFLDVVQSSGALDIAAQVVAAAFNSIVNAGQIVSTTLRVISTWVGGLGRALMNLAEGEFRAAWAAISETSSSSSAIIKEGARDIQAVWDGTLGTFKIAKKGADDLNNSVDRLGKGAKSSGKEAAAAAREQERLAKAYAETVGGIDERIAALQREASGAAELTEADKLQVAVLKQLRDGKLRVTEAQWAEITAKIELLGKLSAERAAVEAAKKAEEERLRVRQAALDAEWQAAAALDEQVRKQLEQNETIGLTAEQLAELEIRRLNDARAMLEQRAQAIGIHTDARTEIAAIDAQIAALDRLIAARRAGATRQGEVDAGEAAKRAAQEAQAQWEKTAQSIETSITDALVRGFESGKGVAENLRDAIKNIFGSLVLRPVVQAIVQPMALGMAGMLGTGTAQAAGGASAVSGLASIGSLFGAGGLAGSIAGGAGWLTGATTLTGSLSAAGSLMGTGTLAGFTSGLGMAAGALGPIALGIMALGSFLKKGGGPKTGGSFTSDASLDRLYTPSDQDALAATLGQSAAQTYAQLIQQYGGAPSALSYGIGFDMDPKGKAQSRSSFFVGESGTVTTEIGRTEQEMQAGVALAVQRMVLAGLQQSDLPHAFAGVFDSLDAASATAEQINAAFAAGEAVRGLLDVISMLGVPVDTVTQSMIAAGGGADRLTQSLGAYVQNFYSDAERQAMGMQALREQFAALGVAMPATREQFRATVEALYASGPAGRETAAAMVGLSDAFAALVPATEGAMQAVQRLVATQSEIEGYWKAVLTPTQYTAREVDRLRASFEALGEPMPETIEGFRILVEKMDTSTDAGRALQIQLGLLAGDFARLIDAPKDAIDALDDLDDAIGDVAEAARDALADFTKIYNARKGLYDQEQLIGQSSAFLATAFAELGQTMPATREQFVALLDAATGTDTEQRLDALIPLWLDMVSMQENAAAAAQRAAQEAARAAEAQREAARKAAKAAKAAIEEAQRSAKAIQDAMRGIGQFVQGLFTSGDLLGLTPEQQLSAAQATFEAVSSRALTGDLEALRNLPTIARDVITAAEAMFAHAEGFIAVRDSVVGQLTQISGQAIPDTTRTYGAGGQVTGAATPAMDVEAYRQRALQTEELVTIRQLLRAINSDGQLARSRG